MRVFLLILIGVSLVSPGWALYDPVSQAPEVNEGWTPAQAADWQCAQMQWAEAVKNYGEDSPQAAAAQVRITTLSRILRPEAEGVSIANESLVPANNGTYAKPDVFNNWVPLEMSDTHQ